MVIIFYFWALSHRKANLGEEILNALDSHGDWMQTPINLGATRQSHVDAFFSKLLTEGISRHHRALYRDGILDLLFSFIDFGTRCRAFFSR